MAVAHVNTNQRIEWEITNVASNCSTGIDYFSMAHTGGNLLSLISNKEFILYYIKFQEQLKRLRQYFEGMDMVTAKLKFSNSLSSILYLNPDNLSMELTHEKTVFYTIKKGIYTIFIQHNLDIENDEDDEAILSVFKKDEKLPSYAGSLEEIMLETSNIIGRNIEYKFEFPTIAYELSY